MAAIARISQRNVVQATKKHTATIFFFHGSGKLIYNNLFAIDRK